MMTEEGNNGNIASTADTSDELQEMFCEPCATEGINALAEGFCTKCVDYLCSTCIKYHRRLKSKHIVENKDQMPQDFCFEKCQAHKTELIKFFCGECGIFMCSKCTHCTKHSPASVQHVPKLAKDFQSSEEFREIKLNIETISFILKKMQLNTKFRSVFTETQRCHLLNAVEKQREYLHTRVDQMADKIKHEIEYNELENERKIQSVSSKNELIESKFSLLENKIERCLQSGDKVKLLLASKDAKTNLDTIQVDLDQIIKETGDLTRYDFKPSETADFDRGIGTLVTLPTLSSVSLNKCTKLDLKTPNDKKVCNISGMCELTGSRLAVIDNSNKTVKIIDMSIRSIKKGCNFTNEPWDVTKLRNEKEEIAVTIPESGHIHILSIEKDNDIRKMKCLTVEQWCRGIEYSTIGLVVSYGRPGKIVIYSLSGEVLKSFSQDSNGNPLFYMPWYMTTGLLRDIIYVSDCLNNTVTCLSLDGFVLFKSKPTTFKTLSGITQDITGNVYVCASGSNDLQVLACSLEPVVTSKGNRDKFRLSKPQSCVYCASTSQLIVAENNNNILNILYNE